jgi:hypothetical protein
VPLYLLQKYTFELQFSCQHLVLQKSRRFEVPLIEQPPVNPLEKMKWYLELLKRHKLLIVSAGAVIVGKAAGLIVF